jgi:type IV pilus assembly protein PilQ
MGGRALNNGEHREIFRWIIGVLIGVLSVAGCANNTALKKDPFFEKWKTLEQTSAGSSPVAAPRIIDAGDMDPKGRTSQFEEKPIASVRLLPTTEISLKFTPTDVKSVLRSLALIVGLNILVKNDIKGDVRVEFKAVPWDQAFISILRMQSLDYVWEGDILRVMSLEDKERDLKQQTQERSRREVEPQVTKVIRINYASAAGLQKNLQEFLLDKDGKTIRGSIRVDDHSNSLIIQAVPDDIRRITLIIEEIDKPTNQIQIKANIVEASKNTARDLGIQWGGVFGRKAGDYNMFVTPGGTGGSTVPPGSALSGSYTPTTGTGTTGIGGQGFGVNFPAAGLSGAASGTLGLIFGTIGGNLLELQLSALQIDGKINILSSPSITTLDNQMAYTENGERVPYVTEETLSGITTRTVRFENVVLRLEITPHVIDGKNLKMKVVVKKDEINEARTVQGNPGIWKKETSTNLIVQDGETIVISGLTKLRTTDSESGLPGLKNVPGLGWLFKSTGKEESMEEVLIFITPTILPPQPAAASQPLTDKPVEKGK